MQKNFLYKKKPLNRLFIVLLFGPFLKFSATSQKRSYSVIIEGIFYI